MAKSQKKFLVSKKEHQKIYMTVFISGKQVKAKRPLIDFEKYRLYMAAPE